MYSRKVRSNRDPWQSSKRKGGMPSDRSNVFDESIFSIIATKSSAEIDPGSKQPNIFGNMVPFSMHIVGRNIDMSSYQHIQQRDQVLEPNQSPFVLRRK